MINKIIFGFLVLILLALPVFSATSYWHAHDTNVSINDTIFVDTTNGRVGIGTLNPSQALDVAGAIKIGTTSDSIAGSIRWSGSDFEGYNGSDWKSLTSASSSGGSSSIFKATINSGEQEVVSGWDMINFTSTEIDTNSEFYPNGSADPTTGCESCFRPNTAGKYYLTGVVHVKTVTDTSITTTGVYKNGALVALGSQVPSGSAYNVRSVVSAVVESDGDDYFQLKVYQNTGSNKNITSSSAYTYFVGYKIDSDSYWSYNNGNLSTNGNVGIGTLTPQQELEIADSGTNSIAGLRLSTYNNQYNYASNIYLVKSNHETKGTLNATSDGDYLGGIYAYGVSSDNSNIAYGGDITFVQNGSAGTTRTPTEIMFRTSPGGSTSPQKRMTIKADGKIGIGTDNPETDLHITDTDITNVYITTQGDTDNDRAQLWFAHNASGTNNWAGIGIGDDDGSLRLTGSSSLAGDSAHMVITNEGKVGIGTTTPAASLHVKDQTTGIDVDLRVEDSVEASIQFSDGIDDARYIKMNATTGDLIFTRTSTGGSELVLDDGGNIGIGTTTPTSALHIGGSGDNYLQLDVRSVTTPSGTDCDSASEIGRMIVGTDESTRTRLYLCTHAGWSIVYDTT